MLKFKYFHTIRWKLRSGQDDDPYEKKVEQITIINNKSQLQETPDASYHVRIENFYEIYKEEYSETPKLEENQFYVDYETGMITFHPSQEGKTLNVEYMGRGIVQYPADRIWVHSPNPYAVDNLQQLIEFMIKKKQELQQAVSDSIAFMKQKTEEFIEYINQFIKIAESKIREVDIHIEISRKQTEECKEATELSKQTTIETNKAKEQAIIATQNTIEATDKANQATALSINATKECIEVTNEAKEEIDLMKIDRSNTRLIWQEPVETFAETYIKYPVPQIGWTVMSMENGNLYRWDGVIWKYIGNMKGGIPLARKDSDGLMSKEDFFKLTGIEKGAQKNYIEEDAKNALPDYVHTKTIVFVLPVNKFEIGVQNIVVEFPNNGVITKITGVCQITGADYTAIQLEKISKEDFDNGIDNWVGVCEEGKEIIFPYGKYATIENNILNNIVSKNDCFRLNVKHVGFGIENLTINVDILV